MSFDTPEKMIELIEKFPEFKVMYEEIYSICCNIEGVMQMYSKELAELDRNTVQYMIEEQEKLLKEKDDKLKEDRKKLDEKDLQIEELKKKIAELTKDDHTEGE